MDETRFGSLEMEIRDVRITDGRGAEVEEVDGGGSLRVEIAYEAPGTVHEPHFAVTIVREDGVVCFETHTDLDGHTLSEIHGRGRISLHIEQLELAGGLYYVNVGAFEREWTYAYDLHHRVYPLRIRRRPSARGVLVAPHEWHLDERTRPSGRSSNSKTL